MPESRDAPAALIVEDESRYRTFLAEVVRDMDYRPVCAATAEEALRCLESESPAIVLLDLNLPMTDGLTFLERFRERCPGVPVVILTGVGDLKSARHAIRLGVSDFLSKPCDLGQLEQAIDRARRRSASGRSLPAGKLLADATPGESPEVRPLAAVEREAIVEALRRSRGNRSDAARRLGLSRRALYNKIAEYERQGFDVP